MPRAPILIAGLAGLGAAGVGLAVRAGRAASRDDDRAVFDDASVADPRILTAPAAPAPTKRRRYGRRLNRSTQDKHGTVRESPAALLAQARRVDPAITLEELTAARLAASEHFRGTTAALAAIVDAELNRAARYKRSLTAHLTSRGTYGKQGGRAAGGKRRKATTARDPYSRHLAIARAVLSGERRGISRGAVRFFDPAAQFSAWRKWRSGASDRQHCHPLVILERWSFDRPWQRAGTCTLNRGRAGRRPQQWVGPIDGIDPLRLMLMRPADTDHPARYAQARALIANHYAQEHTS